MPKSCAPSLGDPPRPKSLMTPKGKELKKGLKGTILSVASKMTSKMASKTIPKMASKMTAEAA